MGLLLSILFSYVGAVEFMFIVRDIIHQVGRHHNQMKLHQGAEPMALADLQQNLRKSIKSAHERLCESDSVQAMADGVQYDQGYRIADGDDSNAANRWLEMRANATVHDAAHADADGRTTAKSADAPNSDNSSLYSSSLSMQTVVENNRYGATSSDDDGIGTDGTKVPDIHFDEYPEAHLHNMDGIQRQMLHKTLLDDGGGGGSSGGGGGSGSGAGKAARRKGAKGAHPGGFGSELMQRRRSEDIDGETDNPWGELKPDSFHDDELWKRERAMSIAENDELQAMVDQKTYKEYFRRATTSDIHKVSSPDHEGNDDNETSVDKSGMDTKSSSNVSTQSQLKLTKMDDSDGADDDNDDVDGVAAANANNASNDSTFSLEPHKIVQQNNVSTSIITHTAHEISSIESGSLSRNVANGAGFDGIDVPDDGKIREFIDYIEQIDGSRAAAMATSTARRQLQEDAAGSERLRHSRATISSDTHGAPTTDTGSHRLAMELIRSDAFDSDDIDDTATDLHSPRAINNRKPNMFALGSYANMNGDGDSLPPNPLRPAIRITPIEDERVQQFLSENGDDTDHPYGMHAFAADEPLRKSETLQMLSSLDLDSMANSLLPDAARRDSTLSDISSDSNQLEFRGDTDRALSHDGSPAGSRSPHRLHERSESRLDELEYIKGRDDWTDNYAGHGIGEQVDSDNYHHRRRYSETADTLEYIRGRDDWLKNEMRHRDREAADTHFVIQDEIDSDEYHHNVFLHAAGPLALAGDARSPTAAAVIEDFIRAERKMSGQIEITVLNLSDDPSDEANGSDPFIMISEATDDEREASAERSAGDSGRSKLLAVGSRSLTRSPSPEMKAQATLGSAVSQPPSLEELEDFVIVTNEREPSTTAIDAKSPSPSKAEITDNRANATIPPIAPSTKPAPIKDQTNDPSTASQQPNSIKPLTTHNQQKLKRPIHQNSLEELIQDASFGPWFHE